MCFIFVLAGTLCTSHNARILAWAIHNPQYHFPQPVNGKYFLVDSRFAHRHGYMVPYKGVDIFYHFQQFYDEEIRRRRNFRKAREKFNFRYSSSGNLIERTIGVQKNHWKIHGCMPSYNFQVQTAVVIATMSIHNFLRRAGAVKEIFTRAEINPYVANVELPDGHEELAAEI